MRRFLTPAAVVALTLSACSSTIGPNAFVSARLSVVTRGTGPNTISFPA